MSTVEESRTSNKLEDIKDTLHLVESYNGAVVNNCSDRDFLLEWLFKYITWFKKNANVFEERMVKDYMKLAHVLPNDQGSKKLLREFFFSLGECAVMKVIRSQRVIHAVNEALGILDAEIFETEEDKMDLLSLANSLLRMMDSTQQFTNVTYPTYSSILNAVHRIVDALQNLAPELLESTEDLGLYPRFNRKLKCIAERCRYYPFLFQVATIEQSLLRNTKHSDSTCQDHFCFHIFRIMIGLVGLGLVGWKLVRCDIDIDHCKQCVSLIAKGLSRLLPKRKEKWYDCLHRLHQSAGLLSKDTSTLKDFKASFGQACVVQKSLKNKTQRKHLGYGMVTCLWELLKTPFISDELSEFCMQEMEEIATRRMVREQWVSDPDIIIVLLDALLEAYSLVNRGDQRERVEICLEWLTGTEEGKSMIYGIDCNACKRKQIRQAIENWFNGESLEEVLNRDESVSSSESTQEDLFNTIKKAMTITFSADESTTTTASCKKSVFCMKTHRGGFFRRIFWRIFFRLRKQT